MKVSAAQGLLILASYGISWKSEYVPPVSMSEWPLLNRHGYDEYSTHAILHTSGYFRSVGTTSTLLCVSPYLD